MAGQGSGGRPIAVKRPWRLLLLLSRVVPLDAFGYDLELSAHFLRKTRNLSPSDSTNGRNRGGASRRARYGRGYCAGVIGQAGRLSTVIAGPKSRSLPHRKAF